MATLIKVTPKALEANTNYQIFTFDGELDKSNLTVVTEAIKDILINDVKNIFFDFTDLKFINSEGIGYLVSLHYKLAKQEKKVYIFGIRDNIKDIFELIGIPTIIKCFDTIEQGLEEIK